MNELVVIRFRTRTGDGARIFRCAGVVVFEATSEERAYGVTRDSRRTQTILGCGACRPGAASFRRQHLGVVDRHGEHGLAETPVRKDGEERSPFCENWAWGTDAPPPRRLTLPSRGSDRRPASPPGGAPPISPWPRRPPESTSKPGQPISENERWTEKLRKTGRAARGRADHAPVRRLVARASTPGNTRQPEQLGYLRDCMRRYTICAGRGISPARRSIRTIGLVVAGRSSHGASVTRVA